MDLLLVSSGMSESKEEDPSASSSSMLGSDRVWTSAMGTPRAGAIEAILSDPRFADVTLRCTDAKSGATVKDFRVNRVFLASAAEIWRTRLYSSVPEYGPDCVIKLDGADPEMLNSIIRYAYFLDPELTSMNALPVRLLCEQLGVHGLKMVCDDLLSDKSLSPDNVCERLAAAIKHDLRSLVLSCVRTVEDKFKMRDFKTMFASKAFRMMPAEAMRELLKSDKLKIKEEDLFTVLLEWAEMQEAEKAKELLKRAAAGEDVSLAADDDEEKKDDATDADKSASSLIAPIAAFGMPEEMDEITKKELDKKQLASAKTQLDFLKLVKHQIRFPVMKMPFVLTKVAETKLLTLEEEVGIMKTFVLQSKFCDFAMEKRKGAWNFEDAIHFTRGRGYSSWAYSGSRDALAIRVDQECFLLGVGLWLPPRGARCTLRIYRGTNASGATPERECAEQTFDAPTDRATPAPYIIEEEPFLLEKDQQFTVEIHQINNGGEYSFETQSPTRTITQEGITLTITAASRSPNSTSPSGGALPVFYIVPA